MENSISTFLKKIDKTQTKSIEQIQKELLANKLKQSESLQNLNKTYNVSDIKVLSPFYTRPQKCSNHNCFCPYHRKLRIKQIPLRKINNRPHETKTANNSPNQKLRTQSKENILRANQRFTVKSKESLVKTNLLDWQVKKKVEDHNQKFEQFLSQFEQILLKKTRLNGVDLHRIKSSVGEIFKYIYTHLDQKRQVVENHISKIEKDRDFTNFYMQRYYELKERNIKIKEERRQKIIKQKALITNMQNQVNTKSRKNQRAKTKLYQRRDLAKKTFKSKNQKLLVERLIEDIDCGQEIEDDLLKIFANLEVQKFQENCQFLEKKIKEMDKQMLQQVLDKILQKTKNNLLKIEDSDCKKMKIKAINKLIDLINDKITNIMNKADEQEEQQKVGVSSHSIKTRGNSIHSINRNRKVTIIGKNNQSIFAKLAFNHLQKQNSNYNTSKDDMLDEFQEISDQNKISGRRQSPKAMTIFAEGEQENKQVRTGKAGKLQLAKYRRLSHDVFYHKKMLGEQDELIYQKMKNLTLQDISDQLQNLAFQFAQKKHKLRDIEGKIKDFNLDKYIIYQNDSLITAKRKIRVIKSLLKDEKFDHRLKGQMKEYLDLIEEQNFLKNRRWANKKIRNKLQFGMQDDEVQLCQVEADQGDKYYFQRIMSQIIDKNSRLFFYQIFKTAFQQKEINFEQHVIDSMKSTITIQKKREIKSGRKKTLENKNKTIVKEEEKYSALIQVSLNNKCVSNSNNLMDQLQTQSQQIYNNTRLLSEDQDIKLREDRYISLLKKLAMLNK